MEDAKSKRQWHHRKPNTLVEVLGKNRMVIEHHAGISCYASEEIVVRTTYGQLRIQGKELTLCCMRREQLCITGTFDVLELVGRAPSGSVE